jgi:CheY-like chemotaxis protein
MSAEPSNGARHAVLVVEDSPSCVEALEIVLSGVTGLSLRSVGSAEEALAELATGTYSALITDIQLPGMDGLELLRRLGESTAAGIPALVISGDPDPRTPQRALGLGAAAFFAKPYSPAAVRRKLEELLDVR